MRCTAGATRAGAEFVRWLAQYVHGGPCAVQGGQGWVQQVQTDKRNSPTHMHAHGGLIKVRLQSVVLVRHGGQRQFAGSSSHG